MKKIRNADGSALEATSSRSDGTPKLIKSISCKSGETRTFEATEPMKLYASAGDGMTQEIEIQPGDIVSITSK